MLRCCPIASFAQTCKDYVVTYSSTCAKCIHLPLMHVAIIWHCDMIDLNAQGMTPIALHSNASYYPYSQVLCAIVHYKLPQIITIFGQRVSSLQHSSRCFVRGSRRGKTGISFILLVGSMVVCKCWLSQVVFKNGSNESNGIFLGTCTNLIMAHNSSIYDECQTQ